MCIIGLAFLPIRLTILTVKGVNKGVDMGVEALQDKIRQRKLLNQAKEGIRATSVSGFVQEDAAIQAVNNQQEQEQEKDQAPPSYCEVVAIRA